MPALPIADIPYMSQITSQQDAERQTGEAASNVSAGPPADAPVGTGRPLTYVFTGGGTGGHVYPGLAIADEVRSRNPGARIVYIGARGRMEASLVPKRGYPIHLVHARGLPSGRRVLALLGFAACTGFGVFQSLFHLVRHRPRMIVATGGYASSPVLLAYWCSERSVSRGPVDVSPRTERRAREGQPAGRTYRGPHRRIFRSVVAVFSSGEGDVDGLSSQDGDRRRVGRRSAEFAGASVRREGHFRLRRFVGRPFHQPGRGRRAAQPAVQAGYPRHPRYRTDPKPGLPRRSRHPGPP